MLGSRQQSCVHRDISKLTGVSQNVACRAAVASRSCSHYRAVDPFLRAERGFGTEPLDIEDLMTLGMEKGCGPCPYFLTRELAKVRPAAHSSARGRCSHFLDSADRRRRSCSSPTTIWSIRRCGRAWDSRTGVSDPVTPARATYASPSGLAQFCSSTRLTTWYVSAYPTRALVFTRRQESVCADAASFDLPAMHVLQCIEEARFFAPRLFPC